MTWEYIAYIILTGFLVRADGWGTDSPRWQRVAKFFNVWSCAGLFALLSLSCFSPLVALACGAAFVAYRISGFDEWQNYRNMFIRGLWPTAIGFALVSGFGWATLLCIPFAALYATIYAGGYQYLPQTILGFDRHVWIEHASGWLLVIFILLGV